jgi:OOP family OmpA-OmpF porin
MLTSKTITWSLIIIWFGLSTSWYMCQIRELCGNSLNFSLTPSPQDTFPNTLQITDGETYNQTSKGNFLAVKNEAIVNMKHVQADLDELVGYLSENNSKILTIVGTYEKDEKNNTPFSNLGEARATEVKNSLLQKGLPPHSIQISSRISDQTLTYNDSISGGIEFKFSIPEKPAEMSVPKSANENDLANSEKFVSIFKSIDLYFPTASKNYIKTSENQKFISESKSYLQQHPEKKILVVGHTDNEDSDEWNLKLSHQRAYIVKQQLISSGIDANLILTDGKGKFQPKASNSTPEGRRANRRVTIVVQ